MIASHIYESKKTSLREQEIIMIKVHAIQTGMVQIKMNQIQGKNNHYPKLFNILFAQEWSNWLPIYAWAIEHPEGIFVVDTGETAKTSQKGYLPFHPYYKLAVRFKVKPEDEIGPQLTKLGLEPKQVKKVIMTHLHTDHAGGLHHFPESEILVDPTEHNSATGLKGIVGGYLPHRWPKWFNPKPIHFENVPFGPFDKNYRVTTDGNIIIVPTPGHVSTHISVIIRAEGINYFLAGDTSYTQALMVKGYSDGLSTDEAKPTLKKIQQFARENPTVYLPSHDPASADRLVNKQTVY